MGQCYSVYINIKNPNKESILKKSIEHINNNQEGITWKSFDETSFEAMIESILPHSEIKETDNNLIISAGFDATYGWHNVLIDWFEDLADVITDTAMMEVYPDEGMSRTMIESRKASTEWLDEEDIIMSNTENAEVWSKIETALEKADLDDMIEEVKNCFVNYCGELDIPEIEYCLLDNFEEDEVEKAIKILKEFE